MRGGRGSGLLAAGGSNANNALFSYFSYRLFVFAMFSFLFLAALSFLHSSQFFTYTSSSHHDMPTTGNAYMHRTFLALNSDPLKTQLDLIHKQAHDHVMLVNAYAAYAQNLKLENARQLRMFDDLVENFTSLVSKPEYRLALFETKGPVEEEVLRQFEKEVKDKVKFARLLIADSKESYDNQPKIQKLKGTIFVVHELLVKARKNGAYARMIAVKSVPKSLHCLAMRMVEERISYPEKYKDEEPDPELEDPTLYHYAIFSDNVVAVLVVVNSAVEHAAEPTKHVFHVVMEKMNVAAMKVWFKMRPVTREHMWRLKHGKT